MIFLVGAQRSGTNWLQRIIAAHPDVVGLPSETSLFSHGIGELSERFQHGVPASPRTGTVYMDRAALIDALRDFCDSVFGGVVEALGSPAGRILERTPDHVRHLDLIGEIYPDAAFVHIVRDGRDVARSMTTQEWGGTIEEAGTAWRTAIEAARAASGRLERYFEVRYEELMADQREQVKELFDKLSLSTSDEVLDAALREAAVGYNVDAVDTRVGTGKWKTTLSDADLEAFTRVAGPTLEMLGYEASTGREAAHIEERAKRPRTSLRERRRGARRAESRSRLRSGMPTVDAFLEHLHVGRFERLDALFTPNAHITITDTTGVWSGRGSAAIARLRTRLEADDSFRGHVVRADVHPAIPAYTVFTQYRTGEERHDRAFVLSVEERRITRLAFYRFR